MTKLLDERKRDLTLAWMGFLGKLCAEADTDADFERFGWFCQHYRECMETDLMPDEWVTVHALEQAVVEVG